MDMQKLLFKKIESGDILYLSLFYPHLSQAKEFVRFTMSVVHTQNQPLVRKNPEYSPKTQEPCLPYF